MVTIVEPEVLMEGAHSFAQCTAITEDVLRTTFSQLYGQGMMLESMILKPNMVLAGLSNFVLTSPEAEAFATMTCLLHSVPAAVKAIAFLSGAQPDEQRTAAQPQILHRAACNHAACCGTYTIAMEQLTGQTVPF
jgi:fructose-bisphosphate aldolase, class I